MQGTWNTEISVSGRPRDELVNNNIKFDGSGGQVQSTNIDILD